MKAVVLKTNGKDAVLLQEDGQFMLTKNHDYRIGEVLIMKKRPLPKRVFALAATAAMLVLILAAGIFAYVTPAYYVSLDVNPSLVLEVNIFERLIGMEAMNEDAESILAGLDWKNKNADEVLALAIRKIEQEGYFNAGGNILITVAGKSEARTAELLAGLKKRAEELDLKAVSIQAEASGVEMVAAAKGFGLTPGKYNLITNLIGESVNPDNVDDYLAISIKDLMAKFTADKGSIGKETAETARQNNNAGNLPSQAEDGRQTAEQKVSEASPRVSEITETLPPAEVTAAAEVEIPQPSAEIPAVTQVELPDVPTVISAPALPTESRRP